MLTEAEIAAAADICETQRLHEYLQAGDGATALHHFLSPRQASAPRPLRPAGPTSQLAAPAPAAPSTPAASALQAESTGTTGRKPTTAPQHARPVHSDHRTSRRMKVPIPRALQAEAHPAVSVTQQVGAGTEQIKVRISLAIAGLTLDSILRLHVEPELLETVRIARPLSPEAVDLGNSSATSWAGDEDMPARPAGPGSTASGTPGGYHMDAGYTPTPYAPAGATASAEPFAGGSPGCMNHPATLLYDAARQFWYAQHGTQSLPGQAGVALAGGMVLPHLPLLSGEAKAVFHAAPDARAGPLTRAADSDDVRSLSSADSAGSDDGEPHGPTAIAGSGSAATGQHAHASDAVKRGANFIAAQALLGMRLSEEEAPFMTAVTSAQLRLARVSYRTRRPGTPTHRASRAQLYKLTRRMMTQSGGWTPSDIRAGVRWQSASSITHPAGPWRAHATPAPREDGGACTHSAGAAQDRSAALKTYVASLTAPAQAQPGLIRASAALGMTDAQAATALAEATHGIVADMEGCAMLHMLAKEAEATAAAEPRAASDEQEPRAASGAAPASAACSPASVAMASPAAACLAPPVQPEVKLNAARAAPELARAPGSPGEAMAAGVKRSAAQPLGGLTQVASAPTLAAAARSVAWARTLTAANLMPTPLTSGQLRGAGHVSLPGAWYRHTRHTLHLATPADLAPLESAHVALHEFIEAHCVDCAHGHPGQVRAVHRASPRWHDFEALAAACARVCASGAKVTAGSVHALQAVPQVPCCTRPETAALYERMISSITRQFMAVFHAICPLSSAAQLFLLTGVMSSVGAPWIQRVLMQADHAMILQASFDALVQACSATLLRLATVPGCVSGVQWFVPGAAWAAVSEAAPVRGHEHALTPEHRKLVTQYSAPIVAAACALHAVVHRAWAMGSLHCPAGHFPEPQRNGPAAQLLARAVRRAIRSEAPGLQHDAVAMTVLHSTCWAQFQYIGARLRGEAGSTVSHVAWASPPAKPAARAPEPAKP